MLIDIPCRKTTIRLDGANVEVLEFQDFWTVRDDGGGVTPPANDLVHTLTNPLVQFISTDAQTTEKIYFRLVSSGLSNPGLDDNGRSLHSDEFQV